MSKKIKLPTGAEAEVVEHGEGHWFGRVPAAQVDWDGTGSAESRLAATEAAWAEEIARTGVQNARNATKVTAEDVLAHLYELRRTKHRRITMLNVAAALDCDERTVRNALKVAGLSWKSL